MTEQEWRKKLGHNIQVLSRGRYDYKKKDLADRAGLSPKTISRYIRGERVPDAITLRKIADALNCTIDDIIPNEEITE